MADVSTPTPQYTACKPAWDRSDALWGGTQAMRDAGEKYLPREEEESIKHYGNRLERSVLFNGSRDAVTRISSKPFSRKVTLTQKEGLDSRLAEIEDDCDKRGTSLTQFGRELLEDGLKYGVFHFIVDYPKEFARRDGDGYAIVPANEADPVEERTKSVRPYFVRVSPVDAIEVSESRLRVKECFYEQEGEWDSKKVDQVRVYEPGKWSVHTSGQDGYKPTGAGTTPLAEIPLASGYLRRKLDRYAEPALDDLNWLNIAHWQSASDQRNLLHVARVPILYERGVNPTDIEKKVAIGSTTIRRTQKSPQDADLKWVEPTGSAMASGADDIKELERRMEVLGIQPFLRQTGDSTATEAAIGESNVDTDVQSWIRLVEAALLQGYEFAAQWIGVELPNDFAVDIWNEFGLSMHAQADAKLILEGYSAGLIDAETAAREWQRRDILSGSVDISEMLEKAAAMADLGTMGEDEEPEEPEPDPMEPMNEEEDGSGESKAA